MIMARITALSSTTRMLNDTSHLHLSNAKYMMVPEWHYNIAIRILNRIGSVTTLAECYFDAQSMNLLMIKTNAFDKVNACVQRSVYSRTGGNGDPTRPIAKRMTAFLGLHRSGNEKGSHRMSKKVLTIDDSKTLRMIIGKHLAPFGVQMFQAENGEVGIVRARETKPDLILLDYNMPVMDGYHTLIELKADAALKGIPVIMLTTETVKETVVKLVKLGLKDYIAKPFTREVLLEKLNPILNMYDGEKGIPEQTNAMTLTPVSPASDKTTILAIDDKANILELLKEFLGEQYNIITADCGRTALHAIAHNKFDYMFLDLSIPDMSATEILDFYLKNNKNGASVKRVVAMTLRTAKDDIERALNAGIGVFLHKPFNNEETAKVINLLASKQKDNAKSMMHFLTSSGKVRILECPPEKNSKFRAVAGALTSEVVKEIDEMAEEGLNQLVIKVGEGFLSDLSVTRKFVDMVEHTVRLSLNVRLVADSEQARVALKQFEETASIPTDASLEFALSSIE